MIRKCLMCNTWFQVTTNKILCGDLICKSEYYKLTTEEQDYRKAHAETRDFNMPRKKKDKDNITDTLIKARELDMSYGQYKAMEYLQRGNNDNSKVRELQSN